MWLLRWVFTFTTRSFYFVRAERSLSGAFFYLGTNSSSYKEHAFWRKMKQLGYQVISKELIRRSDGSTKANLGVEIALDMALKAHEGGYDTFHW